MKKILSTVAALGLVAGVATAASAMEYSMTGQFQVEGYMLNGADGAGFNPYDDEAGTDSAWVQTIRIKPTLKVNDKITVKSEIRFAKDSDWGDDRNNYDAHNGIDVELMYMEYMSPVGKLRMGRTPAGAWGSDFISTTRNSNRLMWWPSFMPKPFSLLIFTEKVAENDWDDSTTDSDQDLYEVGLTYKVDNMNLMLAYDYFNYKNDPTFDRQDNRLKANAEMTFGGVNIVSEWGWQFGDWREFDASGVDDIDVDAMAFMLDVSYKMDKLNVGMLYFWAEGDDNGTTDDDYEAAMGGTLDDGIGDDFNPYYILTGDHTGMLNSDEYNDDANMARAGVNCLGVYTDFAVSDKLSLHGALAYAWADDEPSNVDDEYGWEIDLGAKYKLLDNLTYEVRAGYLATGDFFDDINGAADAEDLYLLSHHLTMTF